MEQGEGVVDFGRLLTLLLIPLLSRCCPGGDQEVGGLCWRSLLLLLLATQAPPGPVPDSSVCHSTSTNTCYLANTGHHQKIFIHKVGDEMETLKQSF